MKPLSTGTIGLMFDDIRRLRNIIVYIFSTIHLHFSVDNGVLERRIISDCNLLHQTWFTGTHIAREFISLTRCGTVNACVFFNSERFVGTYVSLRGTTKTVCMPARSSPFKGQRYQLVTLCHPGLIYILNFWHSGTLSAECPNVKNLKCRLDLGSIEHF